MVEPLLRKDLPQRCDLPDERPGGCGEADPGEADARLRLRLRTPQGGVLGEEPTRHRVPDEVRDVPLDRVRSCS